MNFAPRFFLIAAVLFVGTLHGAVDAFSPHNGDYTKGTFTMTVRKLMRVIVDGVKDLYHKVGALNGRVAQESKKHDRLHQLVVELAQGLNSTSEAVERNEQVADKRIINIFNKLMKRLESANDNLMSEIADQDARFSAALAKVEKKIEANKYSMAHLQTEIIEGTFLINQTINNVSVPNVKSAVRFFGGGTRGKVEVKYLGEWTLICDDEWTQEDAKVVCKMLGLSNERIRAYKEPTEIQRNVKLDKVACVGNEKDLASCPHIGTFTFHACASNNVAAVDCQPREITTLNTTQTGASLPEMRVRSPSVRLVGGGNGTIGRLEVKYNGEWGTVCDDGFEDPEARVVCASLNLPYQQATSHLGVTYPYASDVSPNTPIWLDQVNCDGDESSIFLCDHAEFGEHDCKPSENVGVKCI